MARPVARRRSEADAPDADKYAGRGRRDAADDEDRRPRRGRERGELPGRGRRESKPEPPIDLPESLREVKKLDDDDFGALADFFELDKNADEDDLWEAVEKFTEAADDEPPARGRGRRDEADDEPPRRGRGRSRDDEEDKPRGRGRSRDDEDDAPRGGRGRGRSRDDEEDDGPRRVARSGFAGYKQTRAETSSFADDFKLDDTETLVKFLDDEPFAAYGEHALFQELREGQRVWPCLQPEDDCPICDTGHEARAVALWNIVVMPEEGKPQVKVLKAGPKLEKIIEKKAALRTGPMSKEYYSLSQTPGKNDGPVEYAVEVIRERDLEEEWKEDPFSDDELAVFDEKKYDAKFVKFPKKSEAKDVARKLRDRD